MAWGKPGNGTSIADKMKAAKAQEDALTQKRAEAYQAFVTQYKVSPDGYVRQAILAAYATTSKASGYQGRSADGIYHSDNSKQTDSPDDLVVQYHAAEDDGKLCAQKGDIEGAIKNYDKAADLRIAYEKKRNKASDTGHDKAVATLLKRRDSLTKLGVDLKDKDPGVTAAKLTVSQHYKKFGLDYSF